MRRSLTDPEADPLALDEETVERLLAGDLPPGQAPPRYAEVAALLAAMVADPTPEELAGQSAALAELRAVTRARRAAVSTRRAARPPRRRWAGLAAVALVGALVMGGAAAAATGRFPAPVRDVARSILGAGDAEPAPPAQPRRQPTPVAPSPASAGAIAGPKGPRSTGAADHGPGSTAAGPDTGVDGERLCQAYMAGRGADQGKKLDAAAFEALTRLAGGDERIPAYCDDVQPGRAEPKEERPQAPPEDQGQGQGQGGPPTSTDNQEQSAPGSQSPSSR